MSWRHLCLFVCQMCQSGVSQKVVAISVCLKSRQCLSGNFVVVLMALSFTVCHFCSDERLAILAKLNWHVLLKECCIASPANRFHLFSWCECLRRNFFSIWRCALSKAAVCDPNGYRLFMMPFLLCAYPSLHRKGAPVSTSVRRRENAVAILRSKQSMAAPARTISHRWDNLLGAVHFSSFIFC